MRGLLSLRETARIANIRNGVNELNRISVGLLSRVVGGYHAGLSNRQSKGLEGKMESAYWALLGVVVGAVLTGLFSLLLQGRAFAHEKEMHLLKNKGTEAVKKILSDMLNHRSYTDRSFSALKAAVGGYSDDQIRQLLHEVGARRTTREQGIEEWWYLESRLDERIAKLTRAPDA